MPVYRRQQTMVILWQLQDELLSWAAILGNRKTKWVALDERYKCTADMIFNSLIPGRCDYTFKCVILKPILMTSEFSFSNVIALTWMLPILRESILIQVMAWCHKVMNHQASNIHNMMRSSNGNIFHITGPLCREFTCPWWIPLTKASVADLWRFLWSAPEQTWDAGDSRCHHAHYGITVIRLSWLSLTYSQHASTVNSHFSSCPV